MWGIKPIPLPTAWVTETGLVLGSTLTIVIMFSVLAGFLLGSARSGSFYVIPRTFVLDIPVKAAMRMVLALSSVTAMAGVVGHWRSSK